MFNQSGPPVDGKLPEDQLRAAVTMYWSRGSQVTRRPNPSGGHGPDVTTEAVRATETAWVRIFKIGRSYILPCPGASVLTGESKPVGFLALPMGRCVFLR